MTASTLDVRLRRAGPADQPTLAVFMRQLREDDPEEGSFDEARCIPAMRRLIADPNFGRVWMIEQVDAREGSTGYAVLTLGYSVEFGGVAGVVDELFVARGRRGRGIGTRALELVIEEARRLEVSVLTLEVTRSNDAGKRVYARAGFVDREHHLMTLKLT